MQQAITWAKADLDFCRHTASQSLGGLNADHGARKYL